MMDIQLRFDANGNVILPNMVLATRGMQPLGTISDYTNVNVSDSLDEAPQITFDIYKYNNGKVNPLWDEFISFRIVVIFEYMTGFEMIVEEEESDNGVVKHITLTEWGHISLSHIFVYGLDINTEDSIIYDENYKPTVFYDPSDPDHSLLNRLMSFAPNFRIEHVDDHLRSIQRTFSFNGQSVLECLKQIEEELSVYILVSGIEMGIYVYDALSYCNDCGYRGSFTHTCPKCGSTNVAEGIGDDTTILVSTQALGNNLTISTNEDSIANCYHLQAGDDIMTAAVRQCNPNGTGYIWNFTQEMRQDMSDELNQKLDEYNADYQNFMLNEDYGSSISSLIADYNTLVAKYKALDEDFDIDPVDNVIGYPALIKFWYDSLDFYYYLRTSLLPSDSTDNITAHDVAVALRTALNNSTVAVGNTEHISLAAASTAVMNTARLIANSIYEVSVLTQELTGTTWVGTLLVQNFYNKDDADYTSTITVTINDDYESYVSGKVMKTLYNTTQGRQTVAAMFNQTLAQVQEALKLYSLDELVNINKAFNGALEILSKFKADDPTSELYTPIYVPTKQKLVAVQIELQLRENEVGALYNLSDTTLPGEISNVQRTLNFQNYLGNGLWQELNLHRREASYSDDNYVSTTFRRKFSYTDSQFISDSLTNGEIIQRAYEFLVQAEQKMNENNKYSYQINSTLKNLLVIPEFAPLRDMFRCGNWIRVRSDNGELYKLRLISYEMSYDNLESLTVNFADVSNTSNIRSAQQIIAQSVNLVRNQKKYTNLNSKKFTSITDDIQCDYVIGDSYSKGMTEDNIEIIGEQVTTTFEVLDGEIRGKISSDEAESLIEQSLDHITLSVTNDVTNKQSRISLTTEGGVTIEAADPITLGGEVVFTDNLTDGQTVIRGDNIQTGAIKSADYVPSGGYYQIVSPIGNENPFDLGWYEKTNSGWMATTDTWVDFTKVYAQWVTTEETVYSTSGTMIDLAHGAIQSTGLYIDTLTGDAAFKGTIMAEGGFIGNAAINNYSSSGSGAALDFANTAWKLRSAKIDGSKDLRYYTYLTKNKNFIVSNSEKDGHTTGANTNDVTANCNIGMKNYPWGAGYFHALRIRNKAKTKSFNVLPEGVEYTIPQGYWQENASNIWVQTLSVPGIRQLNDNQYLDVYPRKAYAEESFKIGLFCYMSNDNEITLLANSQPSRDLKVYFIVGDYSNPEDEIDGATLDATFDNDTGLLSCKWESPDPVTFTTWQSDTLIIEKWDESLGDWTQEYTVPVTTRDQYKDSPLVIGE